MLLARKGYRVLLVDAARFPSDTISTHFIWPPGVTCLKRWGLLDRVIATNCPAVRRISLDLGDFNLSGELPAIDGSADCYAPRRTVLDKLLLDAAVEAGVEVREGFAVTGLIESGGRIVGIRGRNRDGAEISETANLVVGADGYNSIVARAAGAEQYNVTPVLTCVFYGYWADVPAHVPGIHVRERRTIISYPTNDGLTMTIVVAPREEFEVVRTAPDRHMQHGIGMVADWAENYRGRSYVETLRGTAAIPNFFRKPFGDGWALVGDAGYHKDPILAQGISDAYRSVEWLVAAVDDGFSGRRPLGEALADYQRQRDEHFKPMYQMCMDLAALEAPPPEMMDLFRALRSNQTECDRYFGTLAGTVPISEYYAKDNLNRIVGSAPVDG
jgi:2-polyprenyl-6-methoxyphenol hydroxylase-like FAD-dependent oxidoreductase